MTTARDVIAKCWDDKGELGEQNADVILRALLSAPESVRLELAGKLLPEPYFIMRMVNRPRQPFVFDAPPSEDQVK